MHAILYRCERLHNGIDAVHILLTACRVITIKWIDYHDTMSAEALRCHSPAEDIKDVFTGYFNEGMNQLLQ